MHSVDLAGQLGLTDATISHYLGRLRRASLLVARHRATSTYDTLDRDALGSLAGALDSRRCEAADACHIRSSAARLRGGAPGGRPGTPSPSPMSMARVVRLTRRVVQRLIAPCDRAPSGSVRRMARSRTWLVHTMPRATTPAPPRARRTSSTSPPRPGRGGCRGPSPARVRASRLAGRWTGARWRPPPGWCGRRRAGGLRRAASANQLAPVRGWCRRRSVASEGPTAVRSAPETTPRRAIVRHLTRPTHENLIFARQDAPTKHSTLTGRSI